MQAEESGDAGENGQTQGQSDGTVEVADPFSGAAFSGSPGAMWLGFGAGVAVFLVIFILLLRGRLGAGAKAASRSKSSAAQTNFFEPAGDGAEITFENEPPATLTATTDKRARGGKTVLKEKDTEVIIERRAQDDDFLQAEPAAAKADKRPAFAGLFVKKKRDEPQSGALFTPPSAETDEPPLSADASFDTPAPRLSPLRQDADDQTEWRRRAELELAEQRRREEADAEAQRARAAYEEELAKAQAQEDLRRAEEARRERTEREAEFERRKKEATLEHQRLSLAEEERNLASKAAALESDFFAAKHDLSRQLDDRFSALSERLVEHLHVIGGAQAPHTGEDAAEAVYRLAKEIDERFNAMAEKLENNRYPMGEANGSGGHAAPDERITALTDFVSRKLAEQQAQISVTLEKLNAQIDAVAGAPVDVVSLREEISGLKRALGERASGPTAPSIQLSDILRNALPPNLFQLRATLPNNRKADCLIRLPHPPGPIAIDASFPIEAFHRLQEASAETQHAAETEFRRTALRHIVDIAERLIVPEETAESALMFIPSESMFAELHARFPDVVQDSYRARVWIVSPTSLMATLHTMRAVMRDAQARESAELIHSEAQHVLGEVDALRRRVVALEGDFTKASHDVRDVISSTDQVYRRAETIHNTRKTLSDTALDRGSRRIPAAHENPAAGGDAAREPAVEPAREPDLWEDNHTDADDPNPRFPLR